MNEKQAENFRSVPLLNGRTSEISTAVSAPETVFLAVETVQRTEKDNEEAESQEVKPSSIYKPLNPGARGIQGQDERKKGKATSWRVMQVYRTIVRLGV